MNLNVSDWSASSVYLGTIIVAMLGGGVMSMMQIFTVVLAVFGGVRLETDLA